MDVRYFLEKAEDRLAGIRGSLLLFSQGRLSGDEVLAACRRLAQFQFDAEGAGLSDIGAMAADAAHSVEQAAHVAPGSKDGAVNAALDLVSKLEASVLKIPLASDEFFHEADDLVESVFGGMNAVSTPVDTSEDFEVDDETLEIFREEAGELISNIRVAVASLRSEPEKTEPLWDIRRCSHTLKGAAGIVGLSGASKLAHAVEDLLDRSVGQGSPLPLPALTLIETAADTIDAISSGKACESFEQLLSELRSLNRDSARIPSSSPEAPASAHQEAAAIHTPPTPVVRVSLDRLDQLMFMADKLAAESRSAIERISQGAPIADLAELLLGHSALATEISDGLKKVRMVRFGVLEMRLNRAVQVTCQEEDKKADLVILDPDVEIDTLIIDAMIEPLLHLIKNAVVHGIEPPETRRLLGKPEKGTITITAAYDGGDISLSVQDDGRGISAPKLLEKAIETGAVRRIDAERMDERQLSQLIFERGLTTAATLNLNAGRGVGMSIVKESVESRGGTIDLDWQPQQGTRFTLSFPTIPVQSPNCREDVAGPLVLIVDDSNSIRRIASKIVEDAGCRAITAINGADALELLHNAPVRPDLILSDVEMPTMDGWQLLDYLKTDARLRDLPVVMVTSLSSDEHRTRAAKLGASGFIVKPFTPEAFQTVRSQLTP